jgi:hypothetical protein
MTTNDIPAYLSLILAVLFWVLSTKQANDAKKTLAEVKKTSDDIKTEVFTWQANLNKTAIDLLSSNPEVVAKQTSLEEAKARNEFSKQMADIIKTISSNPLPIENGGAFQLDVMQRLLNQHNTLIIERENILARAAGSQSPQ